MIIVLCVPEYDFQLFPIVSVSALRGKGRGFLSAENAGNLRGIKPSPADWRVTDGIYGFGFFFFLKKKRKWSRPRLVRVSPQ